MSTDGPKIGDRVGAYVLEERIGKGGFGEVWRARHSVLDGKVVAAKIPTQTDFIETLRKEGIIQSGLDHPAIVDLIDLDLDHEPPYMLLEYVDGEDLQSLIDREAPLEPRRVCEIALGILEPLQAAHEAGTIHRDLKPANVLLSKEGEVKLGDFGLGKAVDDKRSLLILSQTMQGKESTELAGTLAYMAPEQRTPDGRVDERTDIFAFGVILHEMLTGKLPAGAALPSEVTNGLGTRFDGIYRRCCAPQERRHRDVESVMREIEKVGRIYGVRPRATRDDRWVGGGPVVYTRKGTFNAVEAAAHMGIDYLEFKRLEDAGRIPGAWIDGEKRYQPGDLLLANQRRLRHQETRGMTGCAGLFLAGILLTFGLGVFAGRPVGLLFFLPVVLILITRGMSKAAEKWPSI